MRVGSRSQPAILHPLWGVANRRWEPYVARWDPHCPSTLFHPRPSTLFLYHSHELWITKRIVFDQSSSMAARQVPIISCVFCLLCGCCSQRHAGPLHTLIQFVFGASLVLEGGTRGSTARDTCWVFSRVPYSTLLHASDRAHSFHATS